MSVFEQQVPGIGRLHLRRASLPEDAPILHAWVSREHARYWGMLGQSLEQVAAAYADIAQQADVYLGYRDAAPAFLVELYEPARAAVAEHYAVRAGDRGMHLLLAPAEQPVSGFSWAVMQTVLEFCFADGRTERVVVEPDIQNSKIHALNRRAGFRYQKVIQLGSKTAHLAFCTRADYQAASAGQSLAGAAAPPVDPIEHLQAEHWSVVNRELVRKAIAELAHELVLEPRRQRGGEWSEYVLAADLPEIEYRFRARLLLLDHWDIAASSLEKTERGQPAALDAARFILEFRERLGLDAGVLPVYLEEIASTLYAAAFKRAHQRLSAADLVHAPFQELEAAMTEGHPSFIANSGRVGFDAADYQAYAPEAAAPIRLVWLAAQRRCTEFTSLGSLSYQQLLHEELGASTLQAFEAELRRQGLEPSEYLFLPVHPWQWFNRLALAFAAEIAARDLVCLGYGSDEYQAQQSIRTLFNRSQPHKRYVKLALSVLNMGFMRGLSPDYMRATPAINEWIDELIRGDAFFSDHGFGILREVAGIGYRSRSYELAAPQGSPYRKMLAALWRESPLPKLAAGQRLMTMAALLHRDRDGVALLPQLILASGVGIDAWLDRYLGCYLAPLVHCFYRYDLAFMPHGENVILVLEQNLPVRVFLKDIAEEAAILDGSRALPPQVQRLAVSVPEHVKLLSIFSDVFDGILRYVAQILLEQAGYVEARFWQRVAECLLQYRDGQPALRAKLARYDLFAPSFPRSCLNRLQLANNQQMIDLSDPAKNLRFAGSLPNPVAAHFRQPSTGVSSTAE